VGKMDPIFHWECGSKIRGAKTLMMIAHIQNKNRMKIKINKK
jgi:hypothetical protein